MRKFIGPDSEGGQAIVMIAIVFMALLFVVGLAIDSGQLFAAKRTQQYGPVITILLALIVILMVAKPGA